MAHNHLQLHLIQCELTTIDRQWNARDVRSSFWRLYINNRDGAQIWCEGGPYQLPAGKIHLIPAYVRFSCQNATPVRHLYIHFDLLGLTPLLQQRLFPGPASLPLSTIARKLFARHSAGEQMSSSPALLCLAHGLMWESLSELIAQLTPEDKALLETAVAEDNPIRPALQLVEQRLPQAVHVGEMAHACSLSEDHFIRAFRKNTGQTPARYVLEKRLGLAARQLLFGQDSIDDIAQANGFANRFHFSRAFARVIGATPAAYRRTARV